jgi:hypothetical protein
MSQPPVAGVDDQVADRPGSILDEHVLHVADVPVCRPNAILPHGVGASQVMIVMLMALRLRLLQIGRPHDLTPDHAARVGHRTPQSATHPVVWITVQPNRPVLLPAASAVRPARCFPLLLGVMLKSFFFISDPLPAQ